MFADPCRPLLEPPAAERTARAAGRVDALIAPRIPALIARVHFAASTASAESALRTWLFAFEGEYALARGRADERRRRDEHFAQSFGVADRVMAELGDAFVDLNQIAAREGRRAPRALSFEEQIDVFFKRVTEKRQPQASASSTFAEGVAVAVHTWEGMDVAARARAVGEVYNAYLSLREGVESTRAALFTDRPAADQVSYFDERQLLGALSRILTVHGKESLELYQVVWPRADLLRSRLDRHAIPFGTGTAQVTHALEDLKRLVDLAKAAAAG